MSENPPKSVNQKNLPPAITGPSAWYGKQMGNSQEWLHQLSPDDISEVAAAVAPLAAGDADVATIRASDFPLPRLGPKLLAIREEVINGRGFALMRGMPVERWSVRESAIAYYGIGCHFGNARSQNGSGHVLGHVRDVGRDAENDPTARIYQTTERQTFHTDSCDVVGLLCLKTAQSGGESALVSSMTIYNEMLKRRPDLLPSLFEPLMTDRRGEIPEGQKPWHEIPVFNWHQNYLSVIYARRYIESARRFPEVPALTKTQTEALDLFDQLANDPEIGMQMLFQPGDMQWVHNHTMLHDRMSYNDWVEPEKKRHLLRLWLAVPGARPLPPIYAQRYGTVNVGDRGGIVVPGARLNAPLEVV
ncbi:MAG: TauD/TfdA family dioxygenase [Burkholderiaceae bacterium]